MEINRVQILSPGNEMDLVLQAAQKNTDPSAHRPHMSSSDVTDSSIARYEAALRGPRQPSKWPLTVVLVALFAVSAWTGYLVSDYYLAKQCYSSGGAWNRGSCSRVIKFEFHQMDLGPGDTEPESDTPKPPRPQAAPSAGPLL